MATKPQVEVQVTGSAYGAARDGADVVFFEQTIRNKKLAWKRVGTAKWDDHHGSYARTPSFKGEVFKALDTLLRAPAPAHLVLP